MNNLIDSLTWRYATKQYNQTKKITNEQLNNLIESIRLTPTSFGLQAFQAHIIINPEIRTQLRAAAWDQSQFTDASHLIVFTVPTNLNETHIDLFISKVAEVRGVSIESLAGYSSMLKGSIANKTPEQKTEWLARQTYIALGFLLEAAALNHIDTTPMEGFDVAQFNTILKLENQTAVVSVAIGFRADEDTYSTMKKVRFAKEDIIKEIK